MCILSNISKTMVSCQHHHAHFKWKIVHVKNVVRCILHTCPKKYTYASLACTTFSIDIVQIYIYIYMYYVKLCILYKYMYYVKLCILYKYIYIIWMHVYKVSTVFVTSTVYVLSLPLIAKKTMPNQNWRSQLNWNIGMVIVLAG